MVIKVKYKPTWYCESIYNIDLDVLKEEKIKYILTDLDNTLAPYNIAIPDEKVYELVKKIKDNGFYLIIVSNNTGKRVTLFATDLHVNYISGAMKPFKTNIQKYLKEHNIDVNECVMGGDQLMTDIKCATRLNCRCILTKPLSNEESWVTYINRKFDEHYRKKYDFENSIKRIDKKR